MTVKSLIGMDLVCSISGESPKPCTIVRTRLYSGEGAGGQGAGSAPSTDSQAFPLVISLTARGHTASLPSLPLGLVYLDFAFSSRRNESEMYQSVVVCTLLILLHSVLNNVLNNVL